jgi:hypothetical protein
METKALHPKLIEEWVNLYKTDPVIGLLNLQIKFLIERSPICRYLGKTRLHPAFEKQIEALRKERNEYVQRTYKYIMDHGK